MKEQLYRTVEINLIVSWDFERTGHPDWGHFGNVPLTAPSISFVGPLAPKIAHFRLGQPLTAMNEPSQQDDKKLSENLR